MKNITITLDEKVAAWVRVEAAKAGKSVSRYIGGLLVEGQTRQGTSQLEALDRFLSGPGYPGITRDLPSREELYAERLFRRHQHSPVRDRPAGSGKTKSGARMAKRTRAP